MDSKMTVGRRIRTRRYELKLTQFELATMARIQQSKLSRLEAGKIGINIIEANRLCKCMKKTLAWLIAGKENG